MIEKTHKLLCDLESSKLFWALFICVVGFFLLRLPSLFEPHWYGDEGIYEVLGKGIREGKILYSQIWDNKPPLLYATYAIFSGDQSWARVLSLISGIGAVISLFFLAENLFKKFLPTLVATGIFTVLFGLPFLEGNIANAENFMLFPIIAAGLICLSHLKKKKSTKALFLAGLIIGIAFLYKIVAIFDLAAFITIIVISSLPDTFNKDSLIRFIANIWKSITTLLAGFVIPFLLSSIYFAAHGGLDEYFQAIFFSTVGYVGYNNVLLIPQGLLIAKLLLLTALIVFLIILRKKLSIVFVFIFVWTAFSLFNSFFSQRPYTHYLLVLIPSFSLLAGSIFYKKELMKTSLIATLIVAIISMHFFNHWSATKTIGYYLNFTQFIRGDKSLYNYQNFFDRRAPKDYEVSAYINERNKDNENIYVWGNSAQLYILTNSLPPGKFTVAYHVGGDESHLKETREAIIKANPKFIVVQSGMTIYPFSLYNYQHDITIAENAIYERVR